MGLPPFADFYYAFTHALTWSPGFLLAGAWGVWDDAGPMSAAAHIDVRKTADLARLRLTAEEEAAYSGQLDRILHYISQLDEVDTFSVEPAAHPHEVFDVVRPDEPREGMGVEAALRNAPRRSGDQFMVPKVVE